jgi:nickel transport protein
MTVKFKLLILICLNTCAFLIMADSALAHRVNVFAWVEGDTIKVESKFSGGKKVKAGKVVVLDPLGVELLAGTTNDQGQFSFKVPQQTDLRIMIMAGQGHQGEWTVRKAELQGLATETEAAVDSPGKTVSGQTAIAAKISTEESTAAPDSNIQPEELEAVIETVLDRKLQPITRMLAEMRQEGPGISDIFGGIGYILGLVGIALYIQNRKKKA